MKKRAILKDEEFHEAEVVESWSKARVFTALIVLTVLVGVGYFAFTKAKSKATHVLGVAASKSVGTSQVKLPTQDDAQRLLEQAKNEINNLTSDNLTASDGALQKVIEDLQSIQKGKGNPTDLICHTICGK